MKYYIIVATNVNFFTSRFYLCSTKFSKCSDSIVTNWAQPVYDGQIMWSAAKFLTRDAAQAMIDFILDNADYNLTDRWVLSVEEMTP